jgi:hypothetical protein
MLINLEDFDGNRTAILVNEFRIANEESGYRIFYKNFSSPLGRSLPAKGTKFRYSCLIMAIRVVEFSNGGYKIRKVFAQESIYSKEIIEF